MQLISNLFKLLFPYLLLVFPLVVQSVENIRTTILIFEEQEMGTEIYHTRMLVNRDFMRIDDGEGSSDFVLMDRKKETIYSVSSEEQSILVVSKTAKPAKQPWPLVNKVEKIAGSFPPVAGKTVHRYKLMTNGKLCIDLYAAKGLMKKEIAALKQYQNILAGEHGSIIGSVPKEMQNGCDLASNVFSPNRHLQHGFPIRQEDATGKYRQLVDYKVEKNVPATLFVLPKGYSRFSSKDMRSGVTQ